MACKMAADQLAGPEHSPTKRTALCLPSASAMMPLGLT